jgi:FAD/FMN-containing dehydrogenase
VDAGAQLQALAQQHGGHATLFVAPNGVDATPMRAVALSDAAQLAVQRRLKHSLDPKAIFNPQRLFPGW